MVVAAVLITAAYLYALIRDRAMSIAQVPAGATVDALWHRGCRCVCAKIRHSQLGDIGWPIDVIVLLGEAVMGAVGAAILVYTAQSLFRSHPVDRP